MNEEQKRWADGLKQLELVARNAKQVEAIDVLHAACQEMAQQQIQRDALLAALRELLSAAHAAWNKGWEHDTLARNRLAEQIHAASTVIARAEGR